MRVHEFVATGLLLVPIILSLFPPQQGRFKPWGTLLTRQGAIFQLREADCGLAALVGVARLSGVHTVSHRRILDRHPPGREGFSLAELAVIAREVGLDLTPWRLAAPHLESLSRPAVLHLETNHYVALVGREKGGWLVMDPARGVLHVGRRELASVFSGAALIHSSDQAALDRSAAVGRSPSPTLDRRDR